MTRRNPPAVPADTSPEVWRRQMDAIATRSVADRLAEWEALNDAVARMQADAIRRRHPEYDDRQILVAAMRQRYGDELVEAACPNETTVEA